MLYAVGNRVETARFGSEIARQICSDHFAARFLKEALVAAEKEIGDGTARLAVMAGAALQAAQRAVASGIPGERLQSALANMRDQIIAAFASETRSFQDPQGLMLASGLSSDLAALILEADAALAGKGYIELREGSPPGLVLRQSFAFGAKPLSVGAPETLEGVHLIVANEVISDFRAMTSVIEGFANARKALVIAARGVEGDALRLIERNRQAGILQIAVLLPADAGPRGAAVLEDLAIATGAQLISDHWGTRIEALRPQMLGRAECYRLEGGLAYFDRPGGAAAEVCQRLASISAEVAAHRHLPLDREHAQRRHARLSGDWADLRVAPGSGAAETIVTARRAIVALRSAQAGGVIDGGGLGLLRIAQHLSRTPPTRPETVAAQGMVLAALRAPASHLIREGQDGGCPVTDPAQLSRDVLDIALSLAGRLAAVEGAVLRH